MVRHFPLLQIPVTRSGDALRVTEHAHSVTETESESPSRICAMYSRTDASKISIVMWYTQLSDNPSPPQHFYRAASMQVVLAMSQMSVRPSVCLSVSLSNA